MANLEKHAKLSRLSDHVSHPIISLDSLTSQSCPGESSLFRQHHDASFPCDIAFHKILRKMCVSDSYVFKAVMEGSVSKHSECPRQAIN